MYCLAHQGFRPPDRYLASVRACAWSEIEPHQEAWESGAVSVGNQETLKSRSVEHRCDPHEGSGGVHSCSFRVDRIGLDAWGACLFGVIDNGVEKGRGDSPASIAGTGPKAAEHPDGLLIDQRNGAGIHEAGCLCADGDTNPSDRHAVEVGDEPGRWFPFHLFAEQVWP